jgi:kynureninase
MSYPFEATLSFAKQKDQTDPLSQFRSQFHIPKHKGKNAIYFCGNSLGLLSKKIQSAFQQELTDWKNLGVGGYLSAQNPWLYYQQSFCKPLANIVGCMEEEVTVMNSLTVNLHLMLLSFYHPTEKRYKIIMEAGAFPSDQYAVETQVQFHRHLQAIQKRNGSGLDLDDFIVEIGPRDGEKILREEDILSAIEEQGDSLALVLLGGINYYTGQLFDIQAITGAAHRVGAFAGFDLAHAVGNAALQLHDWDVDFAIWCSYKYLNAGPGATGGAYIHNRFAKDITHIRMGGWWGNEEATRFNMKKGFIPKADACGWNQSTAPVFNLVALKTSLILFEEAGMSKILEKSQALTAYLEFLLHQILTLDFVIITPENPKQRGAQLSLYFKHRSKEIHKWLIDSGVIVDYREPGVIRVAPAPFYNSFKEVYQFFEILRNFE